MRSSDGLRRERPIGFSSGALAKGDFARGVQLQLDEPQTTAVEVSALRESELRPLVAAASSLDLRRFAYVSFHAPSRLAGLSEPETVELLASLPGPAPIVVHPDIIETPGVWQILGSRLCLENMDIRKRTGRTTDELLRIFEILPEAGFCFDIGHARQIDPTMGVAIEMLTRFRARLRQLHVSEVGTFGEHRPIGYLARSAFRRVARFVPADVPIILESIVTGADMRREIEIVREVFAA